MTCIRALLWLAILSVLVADTQSVCTWYGGTVGEDCDATCTSASGGSTSLTCAEADLEIMNGDANTEEEIDSLARSRVCFHVVSRVQHCLRRWRQRLA